MAWAVALKSLYVQFGLVRKCSRNILWGTLGDGLWRLSPPLNGALGGTGLDRQVLSGLCMVLLLKGGVYMTRSSPSVCFSSLKNFLPFFLSHLFVKHSALDFAQIILSY